MDKIITKEITLQAGDVKIPGFFCLPAGRGPFPVVIVFHGSDGFKLNHAEIARKLAREGFAALAPTWFGGDPARPHWDAVRPEDIFVTVSWLKQDTAVDINRLGLMGFSRGGGLAVIFGALIPETKAIINYFGYVSWGSEIEEFSYLPLNPDDPLDFVQRMPCPILSFHGDQDTVVSVENTLRLDQVCRRYRAEHQYVLYPGVNHSFVWPGDKYNKNAHCDSWEKAIKFLKTLLVRS
jgi:carboxymethylenebutenolidase